MKINNIVIAGVIKDDTCIEYNRIVKGPPYMQIYKTNGYTLIKFKSRKCRIMGRKIPPKLPFSVNERRVQTMSASHTCKERRSINLKEATHHFKQLGYKIEYEPEIFPAMRLLDFNPICVNLFSSGKVTLLGLKNEKQGHDIVLKIENCLRSSGL
jgi:Transcription factor TFIID (or TATA-binding protein, TBP)